MLFAVERINSRFAQLFELNALIALISRVNEATVSVAGQVIGRIDRGILALIAVQRDDTECSVSRMVERILTYRIFPDSDDRMNESLLDQDLSLLAVPQFTLAADTRKGTRPSFGRAAPPETGKQFFARFLEIAGEQLPGLQCGEFGANMQVSLVNDGPVTFWLES